MSIASHNGTPRARRAAVLPLTVFFMVVMLGFVAFAVDLGYILLTRTQLQNAADAGAMAAAANFNAGTDAATLTAQQFAGYHKAAGAPVASESVGVEYGTWDTGTRTFTPAGSLSNAVRVTAQRDATHGGEVALFFAPIFGRNSFFSSASAVAMTNPRDIAFVVDLSGSMNNDTEPCWATNEINNAFGAQYPGIADTLMQQVYTDFGYGAFPGTLKYPGQGYITALSGTNIQYAYAELTKNSGYLVNLASGSAYKLTNTANEATRKQKAYSWIIDKQIAVLMPGVKPTASSTSNYNYWATYLDYVIKSPNIKSNSPYGKPRASYNQAIPASQSSNRVDSMSNPYTDAYPDASSATPEGYRNQIGYRTYVQFMMDFGREGTPDGSTHVPLSRDAGANCPMHQESTDGGTFSFPPREQPTHASRRAIIAALKVIADRNQSVSDLNQRDWVSIITFDTANGVQVAKSLDSDYAAAMQTCTTLQAVSDMNYSTATENGLVAAKNHIASPDSGGQGRRYTNKVVVLLTDGMPNIHSSSSSTLTSFINQNPSPYFFTSGSYKDDKNAALMQATSMQINKWQVFPVGIGLGCRYDFMDGMANLGGTAVDGASPRGSGNPAEYEQRLRDIFENIISNPKCRLVK